MTASGIASIIRKRPSSPVPPTKVALLHGDRQVTYDELDSAADRIASGLKARGFRRGDRAAIMADNTPDWIETFFAVAKLGGIVVPISHLLKPPEISFQLLDSGARWAFTGQAMLEQVVMAREDVPGLEIVVLNGTAPDVGISLTELRTSTISLTAADGPTLDDLVLLQYTSGTTGKPKAAMHTHRALLAQSLHQIIDEDLRIDDVYLVVPALSWAAGLHFLTLSSFYRGATVALHPVGGLDPDRLCQAIERHRVTYVIMVPTVLRRVVPSGATERYDMSSLRTVFTGSEPVPVPLLRELGEQLPGVSLLQGYGMSEFPISITILRSADAVDKAGSAGKATLVVELRVVDDRGLDVPAGVTGEIILHSPVTMVGYWERPHETAEALVDGWLRTGDLGYLDDDGFLYIVGRKKDMIITGGLNVYPAEVERVLESFDDVAECAVVGAPDEQYGEIGVAHIVAQAGSKLDLDVLRESVRGRLSTYKVPKRWLVCDEPLPRNPAGKVQKHLLRDEQPVAN